MNKKKVYGTVIAVISFAILIIGATFAALSFTSNATNGSYNISTTCFQMLKEEGQDVIGELDYVTKPIDSVSTYVAMGINGACDITAKGRIYLNVLDGTSSKLYSTVAAHCENMDTLQTLPDYTTATDCGNNGGSWITNGSALKYAIYNTSSPTNNTIPITSGWITATGDKLLYNSMLPIGSLDTYYIYVWLDGELIDNTYNNVAFSGYIHTNADQYKAIDHTSILNGNTPTIVDGLIPVKLNTTGTTVTVVEEDDPDWYDYEDKKWANAVLVSSDRRTYYQKHPGVTVTTSDILAYYVWIPRYSYKVWQYSGIADVVQEQEIDIKFVSTSTIETANQNGDWYTHPAFWWDKDSDGVRESGEELSGIWVGKFEPSHKTLSINNNNTTANNLGTCNASGCANYTGLRILPNVRSLRYNNVSRFFYAARRMEDSGNPYGLNATEVDTHMMKNSEWGAAAYMSYSKYGIGGKMWINNQNGFLTGCGAASDGAASNGTCSNKYAGTVTAFPQSTTRNVTGIFDMSGGAQEYMMGVYNNTVGSSEFSSLPDTKYYNNYPNPPFDGDKTTYQELCTLEYCGGHALNETKSWYSNNAGFVGSDTPWFLRGGNYSLTTTTGASYSYSNVGSSNSYYSFRLVLIEEPS